MKTSIGQPAGAPCTRWRATCGQENPGLTALQTLFVREHNHQERPAQGPTPTQDSNHLYQEARAIVGAEIAHLTTNSSQAARDKPSYRLRLRRMWCRITENSPGRLPLDTHRVRQHQPLDSTGHLPGLRSGLGDAFFLPADQFCFQGRRLCVISVRTRRKTWTHASSTGCVISGRSPGEADCFCNIERGLISASVR